VLVANFIDANSNSKQMVVQDVQLEEVKQEQKKDEPPPPPLPKAGAPKVEMAKFTPPKIVKDEEVKEEEKPPPRRNWKIPKSYLQPGRY